MIDESSKWARACLSICSSVLDSSELAKQITAIPTKELNRGTLYSPKNPKSAIRQESMLIFESGLSPSCDMEDHLLKLKELIASHAEELRALCKTCSVYIFAGFSSENGQGGFTLSPEMMGFLAFHQIEIILDLYPPSDLRDE